MAGDLDELFVACRAATDAYLAATPFGAPLPGSQDPVVIAMHDSEHALWAAADAAVDGGLHDLASEVGNKQGQGVAVRR